MLFPGPDLLAGTQRAGPGGVALRPGRRSVESLEPRGALFEAPGADGEVGGDRSRACDCGRKKGWEMGNYKGSQTLWSSDFGKYVKYDEICM